MENGKGLLLFADKSIYEGEFKDGSISGDGKFKNCYNTKWDGEFNDGLLNGFGRFEILEGENIQNGIKYEGEFKNNLADGFGIVKVGNIGGIHGFWENGNLKYLDGNSFF